MVFAAQLVLSDRGQFVFADNKRMARFSVIKKPILMPAFFVFKQVTSG